jgi:Fe-S cluster assembly protein SufB
MGQFERTLIVADKGSRIHYIEGCTAPVYTTDSLHSAVVELIALDDAYIRYTTIQNWSHNLYNLVTKRAVAHKNATVEWVDGNIGSKLTMKYPCVYLVGEGAKGEILSVAFANDGQHQDAGAKMIHAAPNTSSRVTSKSISKSGGRASYRGLIKVHKKAENSKVSVECDALLIDGASRTDTYPTMEIDADQVRIEHEARVSKVAEEQLFYLQSRFHRAIHQGTADGVCSRVKSIDRARNGRFCGLIRLSTGETDYEHSSVKWNCNRFSSNSRCRT